MDDRDARQILADKEFEALPADEVAAHKQSRFLLGTAKKSKHEKEKEAAAKKQQEEEEYAARAYEEYAAAFGVEAEGPTQGGSRGRPGRTVGKGFVRAGGGEGYNPLKATESEVVVPVAPTRPHGKGAYSRPGAVAAAMMDEPEPELVRPTGSLGKKKQGDNFLEQLKRDQAEREERLAQQAGRSGSSVTALAAREHAPVLTGSFDSGDPLTTNIHVGNLPASVTEASLGMLFAQYGPVGSVKIMWPRADGPPIPGRQLAGFVAFLRRPDAQKAAKEIDGQEWGGSVLRTGWGKAVSLPVRPLYEIEGTTRSKHHRRSEWSERSPSPEERSKRRRRSSDASASPDERGRNWPVLNKGEEKFLRTVAGKIREHGGDFEEVMRERERENSKFAFFRDEKLPSYHFFRMLLDSEYRQPPSTPQFSDEGNADIYSSDSAEDSEREHVRKGKLGKLAQRRFECMLRSLTSTREKIARGMAFALEHADAAAVVVDLLVASLIIDGTPVPRKIARLHLVSDVLHNSSSSLPNAWVYRSTLESRLPEVFDHLGDIFLSFPGRMKAEQFRLQVTNIVDVWERDWMIFEPGVIEDLKRRLSGETAAEKQVEEYAMQLAELPTTAVEEPEEEVEAKAHPGFKTSSFVPSALNVALVDEEPEYVDVDGEVVDVDGQEVDVDGEEVDVDGVEVDEEGVAEVERAPVVKEVEVVVIEDDGEEMELGDSDDDMF